MAPPSAAAQITPKTTPPPPPFPPSTPAYPSTAATTRKIPHWIAMRAFMAASLPSLDRAGLAAQTDLGGGEQSPLVRDPLEAVRAALLEADPGAGDEVLHRARHEHLPRLRKRADSCGDVDRDAADVLADHLHLAGVQPDPHRDARPARGGQDRLAAPDRPRRAVEGRERAVAERLHLASAVPRE